MVLNLYMYRVKRRLEAASTCRNFDLAGKVLTGDHLEHTFRVVLLLKVCKHFIYIYSLISDHTARQLFSGVKVSITPSTHPDISKLEGQGLRDICAILSKGAELSEILTKTTERRPPPKYQQSPRPQQRKQRSRGKFSREKAFITR